MSSKWFFSPKIWLKFGEKKKGIWVQNEICWILSKKKGRFKEAQSGHLCTLCKIMIDFLDTKMALKYLSLNFYKQNPKISDVLSNSIMQFYILSGKLDF